MKRRSAYSSGALVPLVFAGVSDTIPERLRNAGDVGGAENGTGVDAAEIGQLVARPAGRQQVHGDQLLLGQDQQTVRLVVTCPSDKAIVDSGLCPQYTQLTMSIHTSAAFFIVESKICAVSQLHMLLLCSITV